MGFLCPNFYDSSNKIVSFFLLISILTANRISAQEHDFPNGISIGESVPEYVWKTNFQGIDFRNSRSKNNIQSFALKKYKGKLILLDFWATFCAPCIHNFPNMKAMQEIFPEDLKIIQVNNEPVEIASSLLLRRSKENKEEFLNVLSDSLLYKVFPHATVPHYVWIGKNGKLLTVSGSDEIDSSKIADAIKGSSTNIIRKISIDTDRQLFTNRDLPLEKLQKFSILLKGNISGLGTGNTHKIDTIGHIEYGQTFTNMTFALIFSSLGRAVFKADGKYFSNKRILYEGNKNKAFKEDRYSYEFDVPLDQSAHLNRLIIEDLNIFSPYIVKVEDRKVSCYYLEKIPKTQIKITGNEGKPTFDIVERDSGRTINLTLTSRPIADLVGLLDRAKTLEFPVIDRTEINDSITAQITIAGNVDSVNTELAKLGLRLRLTKAVLKVLTIIDQPKKQL